MKQRPQNSRAGNVRGRYRFISVEIQIFFFARGVHKFWFFLLHFDIRYKVKVHTAGKPSLHTCSGRSYDAWRLPVLSVLSLTLALSEGHIDKDPDDKT